MNKPGVSIRSLLDERERLEGVIKEARATIARTKQELALLERLVVLRGGDFSSNGSAPQEAVLPYPCQVCERTFSTKRGLNRHVTSGHSA